MKRLGLKGGGALTERHKLEETFYGMPQNKNRWVGFAGVELPLCNSYLRLLPGQGSFTMLGNSVHRLRLKQLKEA